MLQNLQIRTSYSTHFLRAAPDPHTGAPPDHNPTLPSTIKPLDAPLLAAAASDDDDGDAASSVAVCDGDGVE